MKKLLLLSLLVLFFTFACNKKQEQNQVADNTETTTDTVISDNTKENDTSSETQKLQKTFEWDGTCQHPKILKIAKAQSEKTGELFEQYCKALNSTIDSWEKIQAILKMRDSLLYPMEDATYKYLGDSDYLEDDLYDEFESIGFAVLMPEGIFSGFSEAPVLQKEIEKYAPEDFKLYQKMQNQWSYTVSEYPYEDLMPWYKIVYYGEQLYKKYPNSEYYKKGKELFEDALSAVTDIHKAAIEDEIICCYSNFENDFYPYSANCLQWDSIIAKYPNSMFIPIIKKVKEHTSFISGNIAFVVATDKFEKFKDAREKWFNYMVSGKDIVHVLTLEENGKTSYYLAYRFDSDIDIAKNYLDKIKNDFPNAEILKVEVTDDYKNIIREHL